MSEGAGSHEQVHVPVPERLGRRMTVGPFQTPKDILRFLLVGSLGLLFAVGFGLLAGLPFLVAALALVAIRWEEASLWDHGERWLAYIVRRHSSRSRLAASEEDSDTHTWGLWEGPPSPISGRSPEELYQEARRWLQAVAGHDGELLFVRESGPLNVEALLPPPPTVPERALWEGYARIVQETSRGLYRARLFLAVRADATGPSSIKGDRVGQALATLGWKSINSEDTPETLTGLEPSGRLPGDPA